MSVPFARLSCQQCQRRKTKCDKSAPCSACVKAGISCTAVSRHRLPRGRTGKHRLSSNIVDERLARLEGLIAQLRPGHDTSVPVVHQQPGVYDVSSGPEVPTAMVPFVAPDFWDQLTESVAGLRTVLDDSHVDDYENDRPSSAHSVEQAAKDPTLKPLPPLAFDSGQRDPHRILFGEAKSSGHANLSPQLEPYLLDTYRARVDPLIKVLHWPSVLAMIDGEPGEPRRSSLRTETSYDAKALKCAIRFTATCSLMGHELDQRSLLIEQTRHATESALACADLMTTNSLFTLQAFVIYLAGLRACQANAQQWTLTATAVRLAALQGISGRVKAAASPLEGETCRRLWSAICLLDMQSAFDRGSQAILSARDLGEPPLNANDADTSSGSISPLIVHSEQVFTDMSFSVLVHRAGFCQRTLTEVGLAAVEGSLDPVTARNTQMTTLAEFERHVSLVSVASEASTATPLQRYTVAVGRASLVAMRLLLHRPLHKRSACFPPADADFDILSTAVEVLNRSQDKRAYAEFSQWAWFSWVKWFALAVVLAELCVACGEHADRAWITAQQSYQDYAQLVADSESGLLWKPIAKLMRRVQQVRGARDAASVQGARSPNDVPEPLSHEISTALPPTQFSNVPMHDLADAFSEEFRSTNNFGEVATDESMLQLTWDLLLDDIDQSHVFEV